MEHLETQVSDLRSFLPGTGAIPVVTTMVTPANGHAHTHGHSHIHIHGGHPAPRHPSQVANSPISAYGGNSAHPSPHATTTNSPAAVTGYPQVNHAQASSSTRTLSAAGPGTAASATSSPAASAASGMKRKPDESPDDGAAKQQRSKRNRYISIACNECKRRKIKCNGETPCQRCGNLNLSCLYAPNCCSNNFKDSDEYKQMNDNIESLQEQMESLSRLQEQMDALQRKMTALQQETLHLAPIHDRALPRPNSTPVAPSSGVPTSSSQRLEVSSSRSSVLYRGPTSATTHVAVAKNTLHNMGYTGAEAGEEMGIPVEETTVPSPERARSSTREMSRRPPDLDPLWDFDRDEMIRLCRIHEEEVGIMYPVVNINDVINHAKFITNWMEPARKHSLAAPEASQDIKTDDIKTLELKIIMCCALVVEEHGYSHKANRLWENMQPTIDRMLMSGPSEVTNMPLLALVGGYRFLANEEVLAWRVMGQVARLCLEMGLHRRDGIAKIESEQDRKNAINTFWSAYVLDRRWSFGTGFPFVVHDDKVDPGLPYPDDYPYLVSMIAFSRLSAKIWHLVDYFDSVLIRDLKREDFEALDQEILDWYETIPEQIKIKSLGNNIPVPGTPTYNLGRLQIWTRLRLNQIRIWLYTPVLHSASSITQNKDLAQRVVDLAKDTIQYLTLLNNTSVVYRRIQVFYHHFLTSSIAVLFVASTHAPVSFSAQCREEFNMALELVKDLSPKSWVSQRLWRTVKSLKAYAPNLGLQQDEDPRRRDKAGFTITGMPTNGLNQHGISNTSAHRGSMSSGSYQLTPSPGLTPGYGGHNSSANSMGSVTPHGGRRSPLPGPEKPHGQGHPVTPDENRNNGIRLQTEMLRMFEGFANGAAADDHFRGTMGDYSADYGYFGPTGDEEGVFSHMKEMF